MALKPKFWWKIKSGKGNLGHIGWRP